jgi:hypothetical protein
MISKTHAPHGRRSLLRRAPLVLGLALLLGAPTARADDAPEPPPSAAPSPAEAAANATNAAAQGAPPAAQGAELQSRID